MTVTPPSMAAMVRSYAPERTDAAVAIKPTRLLRVTANALRQAGSTTPRMGKSLSRCKSGSTLLDTVPQATSSALMSKLRRKCTSCRAYFRRISRDLPP